MTVAMTAEQYAEHTGADLADVLAMIEEAESDSITKETMDSSTLTLRNFTPQTEQFIRNFIAAAQANGR